MKKNVKNLNSEIEKVSNTPKEFEIIKESVQKHTPDNYTKEEAQDYSKEYVSAVKDYKDEFKKHKNLWDRILDFLAGGVHQSPSERVMLDRWVEKKKKNDL